LFADHFSPTKIGLGNEHLNSLRLHNYCLGRLGLLLPNTTSEHGGNATSGKSDTEYNETRCFHFVSLPTGGTGVIIA
jgi:hypothetical protein